MQIYDVLFEHEIEGKLKRVAVVQGQALTQHLGAYLPQPFSIAFCFTQVFSKCFSWISIHGVCKVFYDVEYIAFYTQQY